jgi:hypothetical protein
MASKVYVMYINKRNQRLAIHIYIYIQSITIFVNLRLSLVSDYCMDHNNMV